MKKIIIFSSILLFLSCSDNLTDLNKNKKDFGTVTDASLFTSAQVELFSQMTSTSVNFNVFRLFVQHWTETTYTDETNYNLETRSIPENHWEELYRDVLKDLDETKKLIIASTASADTDVVKVNKTAIVELLEIYTYYVLINTFGDVPYSEALDIENLNPVYDDQSTIFDDLIKRLDENVIAKLDVEEGFFSSSEDIVYLGDLKKWKLFANSFKLQMGMLISDEDSANAKIIVSEAFAAGVFTSSEDNMKLDYGSAAPNTNPVHETLTLSGRSDFIPSEGFVDKLKELKDPRIPFYFSPLADGSYKGGVYGKQNNFASFSHVSDNIAKNPELEAPLLTYFEVEFLLAEAVQRGFITTTGKMPADHYKQAVKSSIKYWGGTDDDANTYLAQTSVAYDAANYKESIGTQKWIALYNRGFEAWTEWRRLDFPVLVAPTEAETGNGFPPFRYTYPTIEQTLNATSWASASSSIGGDELETKLFWDIN